MLKLRHLDARIPADVSAAAALLRGGRLVAFATETVYGLGANALDPDAVAGIFAAKERPSWDPLIVHLADKGQLAAVADVPDALRDRVSQLAERFWPGPLTLLLPRTLAVPDAVTAGRPLVGVRVPAHRGAQELLRQAGVPIAAPSANRFGHTSPTTAAHVMDDLDGRIDAVLDGGPTTVGVESTVLDPTATPMIVYRPGAVTAEELRDATGVAVEVFVPVAKERPEALPSPGVGIRHYAPAAKVVLVDGQAELTRALKGGAGVLLPDGWDAGSDAEVFPWGAWDRPDVLAARLYAGLRALDDRGVDRIVVPLPAAGGLRDALRDRLLKAAREE